ncbi:MAG: tetratricopeptide repeat protein, partial [Chloroflexota bacterium]
SMLSELLTSAPGLKALITSRAPLRLKGEQEFPVPPLPVPEPPLTTALESLLEVPAVRLFVERAQSVQPRFTLTQENAPIVAQIVDRLDGLPLAIELAAARIKLLSPQSILNRLDSSLKLLTSGAQDLPSRQQTMRSTIAWSHSLLDGTNQTLFNRLGVFVGGFTLEAAEEVCNPDGALDVLEGVASLLNNSLLRQEPATNEEPRFSMLGTIREYAIEQLQTAGEEDLLRQRQATFFTDMTGEARPKLFSGESERWLDRLEADYGNLRAALEYCQSSDQFMELGWHLFVNLSWLWYRRGYLNEARQWYEGNAHKTAELGESPLQALILGCAGLVAMWQSDLATARLLMEEGLQIIRPFGDTPELAEVLFDRGVLAVNQGDASKARSILEEDLILFQKSGQEWFQAMIHLHLGNVALNQDDIPAAESYMEQCYTLGQAVEDRWILASAINNFGELARYQNDHERAEEFYLESRDLFREVKSPPDVARANHSLGWVMLSRNETDQARTHFEEALNVHEQLGVKRGVVECLAGLAAVIGAQGDAEQAARLLSFARGRFADLGAGIWPADAVDSERSLSTIKSQLEPSAFEAAWAAGRSLALSQALDAARTPH